MKKIEVVQTMDIVDKDGVIQAFSTCSDTLPMLSLCGDVAQAFTTTSDRLIQAFRIEDGKTLVSLSHAEFAEWFRFFLSTFVA